MLKSIRLDYNNMMKDYVDDGFLMDDLKLIDEKCIKACESINEMNSRNEIGFIKLPFESDALIDEIQSYAKEQKDKFDSFVVLGIGGSALGPLAVHTAINSPYYNELSKEKRGGYPKFYCIDNVDPIKLKSLFEVIDLKTTLFNCISKSGSTVETMSQFMIIKEMLENQLGESEARKHIVCTTDSQKGSLLKIAKNEGMKLFFIPENVCGRFSQLTPVGLLPAAMCGIDIKALMEGAKNMAIKCQNRSLFENPALMYAALSYLSMNRGKNISVMMPYSDSLKYISDWYAQIWAESLGKKYNKLGKEVYTGQTPVKALGVTDQHSQVQLYAEGPKDKVIVFIGIDNYQASVKIPAVYKDEESISFLGGQTQEKLIDVERFSTEYALMKAGKINMTISLPKINEYYIGELLMLFEMATAFTGELLEINTFDQPGVEEGKNASYAMFGKKGYEEKREELSAAPIKDEKYIIR